MMQKLEVWGALENTLIIFTTDNGMHLKGGKHRPEWTGGYATGKNSPGEGGTHVPCFWYWKDHLAAGDVPALTAHIDLYKTFCDLAGATIPANVQELEGRTLLPLLENPQASWADRQLFIHAGRWYRKEKMRRDQKYAVRTQRWRLVEGKLYDIAKDPFETRDVAGQYPEVVKELSDAQLQWWEETVPFMVNEDRTWAGAAPLPVLYEKQLDEKGIPDWAPLPY